MDFKALEHKIFHDMLDSSITQDMQVSRVRDMAHSVTEIVNDILGHADAKAKIARSTDRPSSPAPRPSNRR